MLYRLINLIEGHADQITQRVLASVREDALLPTFRRLPESELLRRFEDVCRHLGRWLSASEENVLEERYGTLGRERWEENIPLCEVVRVIQVFEAEMIRFARDQAVEQTVIELYSEGELERLIHGFFNRVLFFTVRGYERALRGAAARASG